MPPQRTERKLCPAPGRPLKASTHRWLLGKLRSAVWITYGFNKMTVKQKKTRGSSPPLVYTRLLPLFFCFQFNPLIEDEEKDPFTGHCADICMKTHHTAASYLMDDSFKK